MGTTAAQLIAWLRSLVHRGSRRADTYRRADTLGRHKPDYPVTCIECLVSFDVNDPGCPSCCGRSALPARILPPRFGWRG